MKSRGRILILSLVVMLSAGLAYWVFCATEPTYQGRRISRIIDDAALGMARGSTGVDPAEPLEKAISAIGTNALPYLVRSWARNDSEWNAKYEKAWEKLPALAQKVLPKPKPALYGSRGEEVFHNLGPVAIPQAIALLKHSCPTVREAAARGLSALAEESPAANAAIPALMDRLSDSHSWVCIAAIDALQTMGAASNAIPALTQFVEDVEIDGQLRSEAARALGKVGPGARDTLPALRTTLQSSNVELRETGAIAVWRISLEVETALPVLLAGLPSLRSPFASDGFDAEAQAALAESNQRFQWQHNRPLLDCVTVLGEMGPRAKEAIPQLGNALKYCREDRMLECVTNALVKIDAEAAAKLGVFPTPLKK